MNARKTRCGWRRDGGGGQARAGQMGTRGKSIEAVENRVPIYQGVHEDELDSGAVEVSPLRKYPILPVRQKRLRRITATGTGA